MDQADAAFGQSEMAKARVALDAARELLPCLAVPPDPKHLARYGQQRAILSFFDQDETNAVRWGLLHRFVDPSVEWPFPEDHPLRSLLAEAVDPPVGKAEGMWVVPKGASVFLNGTPVTVPEARAEVPQLVQVYDKQGVVVRSFWQDGAAFSSDLVGPEGAAILVPAWWTGPGSVPAPVKGGGGGEDGIRAGLEVGFPSGVRVEYDMDALRFGARVGGTFEPMDIGDGLQGTVYGGALVGMEFADPIGAELTLGLAYTYGGDYDLWNDFHDVGHAMPLVGAAGTFDIGDRFRIVGGVRAAFGSFVWIAPEGTFVVLF
jgi:hypothetical protein